MRIAICEDEEFIQNSIEKNVEKCLEITGMAGKCECFVSAEELLEKGNMPYALYILDVEMKKLSGLELAEHIRTEDSHSRSSRLHRHYCFPALTHRTGINLQDHKRRKIQ